MEEMIKNENRRKMKRKQTMEEKPSCSLKEENGSKNANKKNPSFLKIMTEDLKNFLFIPPAFSSKIGGLVKQNLFLKSSMDVYWSVILTVKNGFLAFEEGWDDFVMTHSLTYGEVLKFEYEGNSIFTVQIYGIDGTERMLLMDGNKISSEKDKRKAPEILSEVKVSPLLKKPSTKAKLENVDRNDIPPQELVNFRFFLTITAQNKWIVLPKKLPVEPGKMESARCVVLLRNSSGFLWPVLYHEDQLFVGFIGGWKSFVEANKLNQGNRIEFKVVPNSEFMLEMVRKSQN